MRKVFLDNLPKWGDKINWKKSIGVLLDFVYDDIHGTFKIKDYIKESQRLVVEYDGGSFEILTAGITNAKLGKVLGVISSEFRINIGTTLVDDNRNITILDKRIFKDKSGISRREYKYSCNKCGNEDWVREGNLINGNVGCNACCNPPKKIKLGINTIWDTDRWMVDLGVTEEDAKKYTKCSNKKIHVKCPKCNSIKIAKTSDIYANKSIGCTCGDGFSYGHKYMFSTLSQLDIAFNDNVKFDWCSFYNRYKDKMHYGEYDFVIEELKLIIEVDGEFHRNDNKMSGQSRAQSEFIDKEKDRLATEHGYKVIRVFYDGNNTEIRSYICNSKLSSIFDLSNINWDKCEEFSIKNNKIKDICDYWNQKEEWETSYTIGDKFSINPTIVVRYLVRGSKIGWCNYDAKEEFDKSRIRCGNATRRNSSKTVEIFKEGKSLGVFNSCVELSEVSEELFGVKLDKSKISVVANGKRRSHKGYTFKYVNNEEVA